MYWSQGRLIRQLLATRPEVAEFGDAEALASYLRASDAVIVCGTGTLTIEGATLEDTDTATDPVEVTQVQLELPLPSGTGRRRGRTKTRNRKGRIPASARKSRNPRSDHT